MWFDERGIPGEFSVRSGNRKLFDRQNQQSAQSNFFQTVQNVLLLVNKFMKKGGREHAKAKVSRKTKRRIHEEGATN